MKSIVKIGSIVILLLFVMCCEAADESKPLAPNDYLKFHIQASNPQAAEWPGAMAQLSKNGDAFTVWQFNSLSASKQLSSEQSKILKDALEVINQRVAKEDDKVFSARIVGILERAAWADLQCNPLEGTLVPWTAKYVQEHLKSPGVTAELERIKTGYVPAGSETALFGSIQDRVRQYAARILVKQDVPATK